MDGHGPPVWSCDEWSPLREVIVGVPYHLRHSDDVSFELFFFDNIHGGIGRSPFGLGAPTARVREEATEDLAGFEASLAAEGVVVRHPDPPQEVVIARTPWWEAPNGHALMPRDLFLVLADELIETAPQVRSRYFEGDYYKALFMDYFRRGARWTCSPRSRLLASNFDYSYVQARGYEGESPAVEASLEIMFDAAQVMRLGSDLVVNCGNANHQLGVDWLRRHLGPGWRVHQVRIADNHIDSRILPLRPGLLVVHRAVDLEDLPEALRRWDVIWYEPIPTGEAIATDSPTLASESIGMNVLSLSEEKVVVQDIQHQLIEDLEVAGVTPIPCRWRHGRKLGGGFHCMTLDIRRAGGQEDYLS